MPSPTLTLLPNARVQFLDANGEPYVGGTVGYYIPGTLTPKDTWQDAFQTTANSNPLTLDDLGSATVWGTGFYRQIVKDISGNVVWDENTLAPQLGAGSGELFIDTIADAEAAQIAAGTTSLTLLGYYTIGDGGGGLYVPVSAGAGPGKFQSFDGQWWQLGEVKYGIGSIAPEQLGAKGDGTTANDSVFSTLLTIGLPIRGTPGAIYGLTAPFVFSAVPNFVLDSVILKDLAPTGTDRKFVYGIGNASVRLNRLKVLRNGDGSSGSFNTAAAVWIQNAVFIDIVDLEVTGNNAGAGLHLVTCQGGTVDRPYIHDMTAGTPTTPNPGDGADQIAGIWADGCTNVTISNGTVANLLTQSSSYSPENINTRGYTGGGPGTGVAFTNCTVTNVDEGFDMSGDQNMTGWQITACRASFCRKFGFKAAVTASVGRFINCYAYNCTLDGFYLQGSNETLTDPTDNLHDVWCIGCVAENTGFNVSTYYPGFTTFGFRCDTGSEDSTYPRNCRFVDCRAFGGTLMKIGFENNQTAAYLAQDRNRIINCSVADFTQLASEGFADGTSILALNADQSIPNSTDTGIIWNHATNSIDGLGFLSGGPTATLTFPYGSRFAISGVGPFNQNTTGNRAIFAHLNGSQIPGQRDIRKSNAVSETTPQMNFIWDFAAGDVLEIFVNQDSGGSLILNGSDTSLRITDLLSPEQLIIVS